MRTILFIAFSFLAPIAFHSGAQSFPCGDVGFADSTEAPVSPDFAAAVQLYDEGWGGSNEALLEAMERLERLMATHRRTPLLRAYYGSTCIARARMVPDRRKPRWLRRGAAELDGAVRAASEDVQVRLLRAVSFSILPRMAGRMGTVESDFAWLIEQAREEGQLNAGCRQAIYYHAGSFALRNRDSQALVWLERAAGIDSGQIVAQEQVTRMLELAREQLPADAGDKHDE